MKHLDKEQAAALEEIMWFAWNWYFKFPCTYNRYIYFKFRNIEKSNGAS